MARVLAETTLELTDSRTPISFVKTGTDNWPVWNRFIYLNGQPACEIGNICNTCQFDFERLGGASPGVDSKYVIEQLNDGVASLEPELLRTVAAIVPAGRYRAVLLKVWPQLVKLGGPLDYFAHEQVALWGVEGFWGLPHYPKIQYYRGTDDDLGEKRKAYEFIVPLFPQGWLDEERVAHYQRELEAGKTPTAISLSVLDVKGPAWLNPDNPLPEFREHWCLAHYLLDGHHKLYAASGLGKLIHLLAFIALDECIVDEEANFDTLLQAI
ncbi:hypothetical protein [Hymenobacter sp. B81]|uniref:hypothetical protein n=1 Tax=Hymenobacter sp. B81 TaxID=3344878 RepID=UPI0037DDB584